MATKKQLEALKKARAAKAKGTTKKATPAKKTTTKRIGKLGGTAVRKTPYMQWYDNDFKDWGSFYVALFKLYHLASGLNRQILRDAFPKYIGTKEQLKENYPI